MSMNYSFILDYLLFIFIVLIKTYLEETRPWKWSYNEFLSKNESSLIAGHNGKSWTDQNAVWKKRFLTVAQEMKSADEKSIEKSIEKFIEKLKSEKTDKNFWRYIEGAQKLEIIKERQLKLKRKVDLCSIEIFDESTTQQGSEILDLYKTPQKKLCYEKPQLPSIEEITRIITTKDLIDRLKQANIGLTENDFEILNDHGIIGKTFLRLTEEKLIGCGVKLGPAMNISHSVNRIQKRQSDANESEVNNYHNESKDLTDTPPQVKFDPEKFREEIRAEIRFEIRAMVENIKDNLRDLLTN